MIREFARKTCVKCFKGELNPKINLFLKHCTKYEKQVFKGFSLLWCVVVENFYFKTSNISLGTAAQIWAVSGFLMSSWRHTWGSVLACFTRVLRRFVKMVYCMACKCSNDSRKTKNISYHRLPRDKSLKKVWLVKISRENVKDTEDTVLCSEHFEPHCFDRDLRAELTGYKSKNKLKPDAVPTIFSHRSPPSKRRRVTSEKRQLQKAKNEVGIATLRCSMFILLLTWNHSYYKLTLLYSIFKIV